MSICSRLILPRSMRSIRRPGVATTMSTPLREASICFFIEAPPYTASTRRFRTAPSHSSCSVTWLASSRVGTSTRARGRELRGAASSWTIGKPKARVLPDPVFALPVMSRPVRASGIASSWMGNGASMSRRASSAARSSATPRPEKVPVVASSDEDASCVVKLWSCS